MKLTICALPLALIMTLAAHAGAQTPPRPPAPPAPTAPGAPPAPPAPVTSAPTPPTPPMVGINPFSDAGPIVPLRVQVTISRYQGDRRVSSLPYVLNVNANEGRIDPSGKYVPRNVTRLRTGSRIPVAPSIEPDGKDKNVVTYQSIGTNIDCWAQSLDANRFSVTLSIEDSSIYGDATSTGMPIPRGDTRPSFRSFQSNTTVILRDKQTTEFTAAADKITGEVTRIEVSIAVEK